MKLEGMNVKELYEREVKKSGNGAVIPFLKKYIDKKVYVIVPAGNAKLKDILTQKQLATLKKNMKAYVKKVPTGFAHGMRLKWVKNGLKRFDDLDEEDLGGLEDFLGKK